MADDNLPSIRKEGFFRELDRLKQRTNDDVEYWYGRILMGHLGYAKWENFVEVIGKAQKACESAGVESKNHFLDVRKEVSAGSGAMAERADYILSRYASLLTSSRRAPSRP